MYYPSSDPRYGVPDQRRGIDRQDRLPQPPPASRPFTHSVETAQGSGYNTMTSQSNWSTQSATPAPYMYPGQQWGATGQFDAMPPSMPVQPFGMPPGFGQKANVSPGEHSSSTYSAGPTYTPPSPMDRRAPPGPIARPSPGMYMGPQDPSPPTVCEPQSQRRSSGRDEFDGPHQFLPKSDDSHYEVSESQLIPLTISLHASEQDEILAQVNESLSKCAFDFVARYQFPIPIEPDKRPVRVPGDREWTEWCHLLKRLATKRRIPMRVLWNGQIKQLVTVLENSMEMRHAAKHQSRPLKDDRNVLQLISAGLQVAKMLKDPGAMAFLDELYVKTEQKIRGRLEAE